MTMGPLTTAEGLVSPWDPV